MANAAGAEAIRPAVARLDIVLSVSRKCVKLSVDGGLDRSAS
jgi:hypothetical protein